MRCENEFDVSPMCLNKFYFRLAGSENNEKEWIYAFDHLWWTQAWLALLGPILIPASWWMAWIILIFPDTKPDIDDVRDLKDQPLTEFWFKFVVMVSRTSESGLFFLVQLLTWGDSDLRDLAIIYMDSFEAFLYMIINTFWMQISFPGAVIWFMWTWWLYAIVWIVQLFVGSGPEDEGGMGGRGGGGQGGQSGGPGGSSQGGGQRGPPGGGGGGQGPMQ